MSAIFHTWRGLSANSYAGLKRAAHGSLNVQDAKKLPKIAIGAPSHNLTLSGYIFAIKARIDNRKKAC